MNRKALAAQLGRAAAELGVVRPMALVSNPVASLYLDAIPSLAGTIYLRLDDYSELPGVDPQLVRKSEQRLFQTCSRVVVTAKALALEADALYLPQGVDHRHFATLALEPPRSKTLGFFGLLAEWIDWSLIEEVATLVPDWRLEFIGPARFVPERIRGLSNVRFRGPVPYEQLPSSIRDWSAAWAPFVLNELTQGVNPLKCREYLAAGLPTAATPLPELSCLMPNVQFVGNARGVLDWLRTEVENDDSSARLARRHSVRKDSWNSRAQLLRAAALSALENPSPLPAPASRLHSAVRGLL